MGLLKPEKQSQLSCIHTDIKKMERLVAGDYWEMYCYLKFLKQKTSDLSTHIKWLKNQGHPPNNENTEVYIWGKYVFFRILPFRFPKYSLYIVCIINALSISFAYPIARRNCYPGFSKIEEISWASSQINQGFSS